MPPGLSTEDILQQCVCCIQDMSHLVSRIASIAQESVDVRRSQVPKNKRSKPAFKNKRVQKTIKTLPVSEAASMSLDDIVASHAKITSESKSKDSGKKNN